MASSTKEADENSIFLNIPFDDSYEKLFVALVACVVAAGFRPRCAVEFPERGQGQLDRIIDVMQECHRSIHDLSRPRGNMALELGYWMGLNHSGKAKRDFIVLCGNLKSFERDFSDLRKLRPIVHSCGPIKLIAGLADNLDGLEPEPAESIYRQIMTVLPELKRKRRTRTCFTRKMFKEICEGAALLAGAST